MRPIYSLFERIKYLIISSLISPKSVFYVSYTSYYLDFNKSKSKLLPAFISSLPPSNTFYHVNSVVRWFYSYWSIAFNDWYQIIPRNHWIL